MARALVHPAPVAGAYLLLAIALTWPLAAQWTRAVPAGSIDLWQNYWNFWWWRTCLLDLRQSPFFTQYLFHPTGASMVFYTHSPLNMLATLPISTTLGYAAAYNVCVLVALAGSGLTMFLFVRQWTGSAAAAFLAGLVFAFFPQHLEQTFEHLNLISTEFMPLAGFFLIRLSRRRRWGDAAGLGLAYALNALLDWHLGILLTLALVPLAVAEVIAAPRPRRPLAGRFALAVAVAALGLLPAVWPLLRGLAGEERYFQKPVMDRGVDPFFMLIPNPGHPLWGRWVAPLYENRRAYPNAGFVGYLGFVPIGLAALAVARRARGWALWTAILLAATLLALGARPILGGRIVEAVRLPFAALADIPILRLMRVANRFLILTSLALAMLVGLGWTALRRPSAARFTLLAGAILFEYLWWPYPTRPVELSPYYGTREAASGRGALLDLPFSAEPVHVLNMLAQTFHGRPIAGGYLSTTPPAAARFLETDPTLAPLVGTNPRRRARIDAAGLRRLGFGTVVLHRRTGAASPVGVGPGRPGPIAWPGLDERQLIAFGRLLEVQCGPPIYEDEAVIVFDLPPAP